MNKGIFITGTDTGVGKTFVAAGLINSFRKRNMNVCPMKPVETGCSLKKGILIPEDTMKLFRAAGIKETIDQINPYRFRHPLAPSVASTFEGIKIDKKKIISSFKLLKNKYDIVIAEGSGGVMVPVSGKYLFLDLIKDMRVPVIIVTRPGLGTINHTLLTIKVLKNKRIDITGLVINYSENTRRKIAEKTNPEIIEKLSTVPLLGIIPFTSNSRSKSVEMVFNHITEKLFFKN